MTRYTDQSFWLSDRTLAVTGSKGGVGKSNLVVNLAVALGRMGRRVVVVDGDLGLANLDVLLGLTPARTVEHLLDDRADPEELLIEGPAGIRILPAASGVPQLTRLDGRQREKMCTALATIASAADDVLIDTGAGLGQATLSLQLAASRVVVVTTPEPTSIVDAYATMKVLWDADPNKRIDLVVNSVPDDDEAEKIHLQMSKACRHFLTNELGWIGPVYHDPEVGRAVKRQRALIELRPHSRAARCYERIAMRLSMEKDAFARPGGSAPLTLSTNEETYH